MRRNFLQLLSSGLNYVLLILIFFFTAGVFFRLPVKYYNEILLPCAAFIVIGLVILIIRRILELRQLRGAERTAGVILKKAGSLAVHASVILILVAWFLSSFFARSTYVEGREGATLRLAPYGFAFDVKIDTIRAEVYDDGSPRQYSTSFAVIRGTEKITAGTAAVNKPFIYEGTKIYQYGYKENGTDAVTGFLIKTDPGVGWLYAGAVLVPLSALLKILGMKIGGKRVTEC